MTNLEYYKDLIKKIGIGSFSLTSKGVGECWDTECAKCFFGSETGIGCHNEKVDWLLMEHEEQEIDWDNGIDWRKVPADTDVLVGDEEEILVKRKFALYLPGTFAKKYVTFANGDVQSDAVAVCSWNYCKLANPEDIEKYRKR